MKRNLMTVGILKALIPVRPGDGTPELELSYESQDDIPAGFESLYTEKDGKFTLTRVKGLKTTADIERLQTALNKERSDHKTVKQQLAALASHGTVEDIVAQLERIPELEAKQGKGDPADVEKLISARLTPLQRKLDEATNQLKERDQVIESFKGKEVKATVADAVRKAAKSLKIRDSAIEDAIMYGERVLTIDESGNVVTKEGVGVTPYITADDWLRDLLPNRQHWLEDSFGGGAQGGKGGNGATVNPYSYEDWSVSKQMELYRANPEKAKKMAARHGVDPLNPKRPAKKS